MPILDTNVFTQIAKGNVPAAEALRRMVRSGNIDVYIARASYNELVNGSPTQELRDGYRAIIEDMEIAIAPQSSLADRIGLHADNPGDGNPGRIKQYGNGAAKARPGDAFVAAEARALRAELWTMDAELAQRAHQLGVRVARESSLRYVQGTENIGMARRLLGLRRRINLKLPSLSSLKLKLGAIKIGGRGGLAVKLVRGLGVAIVFALIGGWLTARRDKASVKEGLERVEGEIQAKLKDFSRDIAWLQLRLDAGEKAYLNCHIEIHIGTPRWNPMLSNPYYDYPTGSFDGMPTVWLAEFNGIVVSTRNEEKEWKEDFFPPGTRIRHFMRSMEVEVFSKDELEIYGELTTDYMDYELKLRMDPGNQVWREEAATMRRELVQAFGNDLWFLANKELTE